MESKALDLPLTLPVTCSFELFDVCCCLDLAGFAPSRIIYFTKHDGAMKEAGYWSSSAWSLEWLLGTSGPGCAAISNGHVTSYLGGNQYICALKEMHRGGTWGLFHTTG